MVTPNPLSRTRLARENLLSLSEAAKVLPRVNGRRHATSTLYRWSRRGIRGTRLEYLRIGRAMVTSREALDRFFVSLAAADDGAVSTAGGNGCA